MNDDEILVLLSQFLPFGPKRIQLLIEYFGKSKNIWNVKVEKLKEIGLSDKIIYEFDKYRRIINTQNFFKRLDQNKIKWVSFKGKGYPLNLRGLDDAPVVLFYKGKLISSDSESIAIVGSRKMTSYGKNSSYMFSSQLAKKGVTIISGLARGVDTQAHLGALDSGGRTIAVLTDLEKIYPYENKLLAERIINQGALISEYAPGTYVTKASFVLRNRIVSGLSKGVLVIEGEKKSGTLITASFAAEQGKTVFAVPGPITSKNSGATSFLIQNGAKLTTSVSDIFDEIKFLDINPK